MTLKTMAELNAAEPHLRDLEITVDGLNVVDIQFAGPGVWVPRFTVQISGDQGIDETTGQRRAYLAAAEYLRATLLNNGTGDGSKPHAFVPHANISRDDEPGDQDAAVAVAHRAITRLLDIYNGVDPENDGQPIEEDLISVHGKSLHIVVRTVDFDLTEKRILSAGEFDKLQAAIDNPANPSDKMVSLMSKDKAPWDTDDVEGLTLNNTTRVENAGEPLDDSLVPTNNSKYFDGVLHVGLTVPGKDGMPTLVYWVPADQATEFQSPADLLAARKTTLLNSDENCVEHRVELLTDTVLTAHTTTKLFDGIQHVRNELHDEDGPVIVWVPEGQGLPGSSLDELLADELVATVRSTDYGSAVREYRLL